MSEIGSISGVLPTVPIVTVPVQVSAPEVPAIPAPKDQVTVSPQAQQQAAVQESAPIIASVVYRDANNQSITYSVNKDTGKREYSPEPSFIRTMV